MVFFIVFTIKVVSIDMITITPITTNMATRFLYSGTETFPNWSLPHGGVTVCQGLAPALPPLAISTRHARANIIRSAM